jgi:hypothetical protein
MALCSPLSEVVVANATEVENVDRVISAAEIARMVGLNPATSDGEGQLSSPNVVDDSLGEGAFDDKNLWTYYLVSSTITVDKIKEMVEKGYFVEVEAHVPDAETVPEPNNDEAIVYEDFLLLDCACLLILL